MDKKQWDLRQRELLLVLERLGWWAEDLREYLHHLSIDVSLNEVELWLTLDADEAPGMLPRWPALLLRANLLGSVDLQLKNFTGAEFGRWWPLMDFRLLSALDYFRELLGRPVMISPAGGSLGRFGGSDKSLHNVERYGVILAVDVMLPAGPDARLAYQLAVFARVFSGIGIYPHWKPHLGLHLDVRHVSGLNPTPTATPYAPATWGALRDASGKQVYVSVAEALRD